MNRARGFSLIEVMLATALLAAGMALAFATLLNSTRATERAEDMSQRSERLRAVQAFVRRQIEGALAIPYEYEDGTGEATLFAAGRDEVKLVAPMPGYLSRGGPYVQTFRLVRGGQGLRLEFEHQLLTPDGPIESEREPEILLDGIAEGAFAFRTLTDQGEPGDWLPRWEESGRMPRLVKLELRLRDPGAAWPALVVAPRQAASVVSGPVAGFSPGEGEDQ